MTTIAGSTAGTFSGFTIGVTGTYSVSAKGNLTMCKTKGAGVYFIVTVNGAVVATVPYTFWFTDHASHQREASLPSAVFNFNAGDTVQLSLQNLGHGGLHYATPTLSVEQIH
jgi:hypothetical protein